MKIMLIQDDASDASTMIARLRDAGYGVEQALDQPLARTSQLFALVQRFINDCLGSRELTPERIATAHHMSLRSLQRLFHMHGSSVAGWIRKQRLDRCRRDLADPLWAAQPVSGIAKRWGFRNAAHFSRTFKQTYGVSPSRFRQGGYFPEHARTSR